MDFTTVRAGQKYSADAIDNYGLLKSPLMMQGAFMLKPRIDLSAQDSNVYNLGGKDSSRVYEVREAHPKILSVSAEYAASQTGVSVLAAPGAGKRYVVIYASIATESTSGVAYFHGGVVTAALKCYFSSQTRGDAQNIEREWPENTVVLFTSTQGAKGIYYALEYYIADV